ncbi:unnamed protein product, partial [Symbiodinium microadriaticum]
DSGRGMGKQWQRPKNDSWQPRRTREDAQYQYRYWPGSWAVSPRAARKDVPQSYDQVQIDGNRKNGTAQEQRPWRAPHAEATGQLVTMNAIQKALTTARKADGRIRKLVEDKSRKQKQWDKWVQDQRANYVKQKRQFQQDLEKIDLDLSQAEEVGTAAAARVKDIILHGPEASRAEDGHADEDAKEWESLVSDAMMVEPSGFYQEAYQAAQQLQRMAGGAALPKPAPTTTTVPAPAYNQTSPGPAGTDPYQSSPVIGLGPALHAALGPASRPDLRGPELPPGGEADATMAAPPIAGANSADPAALAGSSDEYKEEASFSKGQPEVRLSAGGASDGATALQQVHDAANLEAYGDVLDTPVLRACVLIPGQHDIIVRLASAEGDLRFIIEQVQERVSSFIADQSDLLPVSHQAFWGVLTLVAVPRWIASSLRTVVIFDLTAIGGPFFADIVWQLVYRSEVEALAAQHSGSRVNVYTQNCPVGWAAGTPYKLASGQVVQVRWPDTRPKWCGLPATNLWSLWTRAEPPIPARSSWKKWLIVREDGECLLDKADVTDGDLYDTVAEQIGSEALDDLQWDWQEVSFRGTAEVTQGDMIQVIGYGAAIPPVLDLADLLFDGAGWEQALNGGSLFEGNQTLRSPLLCHLESAFASSFLASLLKRLPCPVTVPDALNVALTVCMPYWQHPGSVIAIDGRAANNRYQHIGSIEPDKKSPRALVFVIETFSYPPHSGESQTLPISVYSCETLSLLAPSSHAMAAALEVGLFASLISDPSCWDLTGSCVLMEYSCLTGLLLDLQDHLPRWVQYDLSRDAGLCRMLSLTGYACIRNSWWRQFAVDLRGYAGNLPVVILGDLNLRLIEPWGDSVGDLCWEDGDSPPSPFFRLLTHHELWIPSTFTACHRGLSHTWVSPGQGALSRIDYVIVPQAWGVDSGSSRVLYDVDFGQVGLDHYSVYLETSALLHASCSKGRRPPRIDVSCLHSPGNAGIVKAICQTTPAIPWSVDAHTHYDLFARHLVDNLALAFPAKQATKRKTFFSESTWSFRQQRVSLRKIAHRASAWIANYEARIAWVAWHCDGPLHWAGLLSLADLLRSIADLHRSVGDLRSLKPLLRRSIQGDKRSFTHEAARAAATCTSKDGSIAEDLAEAEARWIRHFSSIEGARDLADYDIEAEDLLTRGVNAAGTLKILHSHFKLAAEPVFLSSLFCRPIDVTWMDDLALLVEDSQPEGLLDKVIAGLDSLWTAEVQQYHGLLFRQLRLAGAYLDELVAEAASPEICAPCGQVFPDKRSWSHHAFKVHGRVREERQLVTGQQCPVCLRAGTDPAMAAGQATLRGVVCSVEWLAQQSCRPDPEGIMA